MRRREIQKVRQDWICQVLFESSGEFSPNKAASWLPGNQKDAVYRLCDEAQQGRMHLVIYVIFCPLWILLHF